MKNKGQNLVEFGMILGAVVVVCIIALTFFGDNVKALFTGSSSKYNKQTAFKWKEGTASPLNQTKQYTSNVPTGYDPNVKVDSPVSPNSSGSPGISTVTTSPSIGTTTIAGVTVTKHQDGTLSFMAAGQEVFISPRMQELSDIAFETAGGAATSNLIKEISYMMEKHAAEYPAGVPIEVFFGDSDRNGGIGAPVFLGTAEVNAFTVKVGSDLVVLAKDQECGGNTMWCKYQGTYRIEGSYDSSNNFSGNAVSEDAQVTGPLGGTIDTKNGMSLSDPSAYMSGTDMSWSFNWTINCDQSNKFDITS